MQTLSRRNFFGRLYLDETFAADGESSYRREYASLRQEHDDTSIDGLEYESSYRQGFRQYDKRTFEHFVFHCNESIQVLQIHEGTLFYREMKMFSIVMMIKKSFRLINKYSLDLFPPFVSFMVFTI